MSSGVQFVVAAYAVVLFVVVMYLVVVGMRSARLAREAELLTRIVESRLGASDESADAQPEAAVGPRDA